MGILEDISANLQAGNAVKLKELTLAALDQGVSASQILEEGLIAGMSIVGGKFKRNEIFSPEVLIVARAMKGAMEVLKPDLRQPK